MKASQPDLIHAIEKAQERDTVALKRLYGECAAWLRAGKSPPPELASWLAERLEGLAQALDSEFDRQKLESAAARALQIRRAGGAGKAKKAYTEAKDRALIGDVYHFMDWHDMNAEQAIWAVADYHKRNGGPDLLEQIRYAWKHRKTLFPVDS